MRVRQLATIEPCPFEYFGRVSAHIYLVMKIIILGLRLLFLKSLVSDCKISFMLIPEMVFHIQYRQYFA